MAKDLTIFGGDNFVVPDYLSAFMDEESNIGSVQTVPTLTYAGKVWVTSVDGEKKRLERPNAEGDMEPVSVLRVVILDGQIKRGRDYYDGPFDPNSPKSPDCWSIDGEKPHSSVKNPQCSSCGKCPQSIKGSKMGEDGREGVACGEYRLLAVIPAGALDSTPLRLKLRVTSDYDVKSTDLQKEGWFAFKQFKDFLRAKRVMHTATIVTKLKFDPSKGITYPKILFSPDRLLTQDEFAKVRPLIKAEATQALISDAYTPNGADGEPTGGDPEDATEQPKPKPNKPAPAAQAKPKAEPKEVANEPFITDEMEQEERQPAKPKPAAKAKAAPPPAENTDGDEDTGGQPASTNVPDDVSSLLDDWG